MPKLVRDSSHLTITGVFLSYNPIAVTWDVLAHGKSLIKVNDRKPLVLHYKESETELVLEIQSAFSEFSTSCP